MSWTQLSGQTYKICYTHAELQEIANKLIQANECDTLYKISQLNVKNKEEQICILENIIVTKDSIHAITRSIVLDDGKIIIIQKSQIDDLQKQAKKNKRKLKMTRIGWVSTTAGLLLLLILI